MLAVLELPFSSVLAWYGIILVLGLVAVLLKDLLEMPPAKFYFAVIALILLVLLALGLIGLRPIFERSMAWFGIGVTSILLGWLAVAFWRIASYRPTALREQVETRPEPARSISPPSRDYETNRAVPRLWEKISGVLPQKLRKEAFEPAYNDLLLMYFSRRTPSRRSKLLKVLFTMRVGWLLVQSYKASFTSTISRFLDLPWRF